MKAIPGELYEAAAVDGANALQRFRHVTLPGLQEHPDHRDAALDDLDLQRLRASSTSSPRAARAAPPGAARLHLRDGLRRPAAGRGHRRRPLHAAGAGRGHHRAGPLHAAGARASERAAIEPAPARSSYAFLGTLLLLVLFPFYWMTITSFKTEDQMRSLVSMFWPRPSVARELRAAPDQDGLRRLVRQQRGGGGVEHARGHRHRHHRRLRAGPAALPGPRLHVERDPHHVPGAARRSCSSRSTRRSEHGAWPTAWPGSSPPIRRFTVPFVTWLLMGYFESIPEELEEAAMIDGATRFGAFRRIILPLAAPGVLAAGALRLHPGLERVPLRAGLHHRRQAAHVAGGPLHLHHRRRLRLGLPDGRRRADHLPVIAVYIYFRSTWWKA